MNHHAYFFEGPFAMAAALAADARRRFGFTDGAGLDAQLLEIEKFGIGEARDLVRRTALKSASGRALFVISVSSITRDAQQALLKLFEEPMPGTVFVLLLPHGALVPTLRSRMLRYPDAFGKDGALEDAGLRRRLKDEAKKFLAGGAKERSALVAALTKDEEGVKERARALVCGLERELYARFQKKRDGALREPLEDCALARAYIGDHSASLKMILEHLALALPSV